MIGQALIEVATETEMRQAALDSAAAKQILEVLGKHYPGHLWKCTVHRGVADIQNLNLSGRWGFRMFLDQQWSASILARSVMMAGGELLERYRVSRGKAQQDELAQLPTDFTGRVVLADA
jgi:hypothetical protein